jgi:hydroxymethylpyrimidine/phosphomethylpyrimidine kinase
MKDQLPIAMTIAGSDPSGGAGIQADLKTFAVIGIYGAAAVTSLTAQNTTGVSGCFTLSQDIISRQIASVLDDLYVTHIKIGMTGNSKAAEAIADALDGFTGEVIYDPVRISSGGADLMTGEDNMTAWRKLISRATVLTPNLIELEELAGRKLQTPEEALDAACKTLGEFPCLRAICLTGGHFQGTEKVTDYLIRKPQEKGNGSTCKAPVELSHRRIQTNNLHGTGCTFASAFTAFHLLSKDDEAAFSQASHFVHQLIKESAATLIGRGTGPLIHHLWPSGKR